MCGICFVCGVNCSEEELHKNIKDSEALLCSRGPDGFSSKVVHLSSQVSGLFQGSVLWLQGRKPVQQPVVSSNGDVLLWNGDILDGVEVPEGDTRFVSDMLAAKREEEIVSFFHSIKGPWSFVFYKKTTGRLYFGRDCLGRHSLLWSFPSSPDFTFKLASVFVRTQAVSEVPALGLFYIDLKREAPTEAFEVNLIPWSSVADEDFSELKVKVNILRHTVKSPIRSSLNMLKPLEMDIRELMNASSASDKEVTTKMLDSQEGNVNHLIALLTLSIQRRVNACPPLCKNCTHMDSCTHSKFAVLFSGGLDSAVIALLTDSCVPSGEDIDLINVSFEQVPFNHAKSIKVSGRYEKLIKDRNGSGLFEVPDRLSGRMCWQQLCQLRPNRQWNFVEVNVTLEELQKCREDIIGNLIAPLTSVLDDSIGCALWFGGRGKGHLNGKSYTSPARVIFCGMGADEQLAGYSRHRAKFDSGGWAALLEEVRLEISRIHARNLGRDDRILSSHGRAPRFPYLDEDVVSFLNSLPIWEKANLYLPRGVGEKFLLRAAAAQLGLTEAASLPKRAIQFGTRIAKLENSREKGSDCCARLISK